jgi:predicted NBD/HSP70 family sugar kinase
MRKLGCDDMRILNMVYIQVTKKGVGAGIITNGQLVRGNSNFAGELGFMPLSNGTYLNGILDSNQDDETYADTIARMIATVNCIINPSFIVIGGEIFRFKLIEQIKENCKRYIKEDVIPDIFLGKDSRRDCLAGITHLTMELMYSGVKLIDNTTRIE